MSLTPEIDKNGKQIHRWEKEVADFHERLKDHRSAMLDRFKPVVLMQNTPEIYQQLGVQDRPIEITPNAIDKILASKFKRSDGHGLPVEIAKEIPKALHNPLMVFAPDPAPEGKSRPERAQNSLVVLTTIEHNRKPLFIIIQMDTRSGRSNLVHRISSSYERPEQDVKKWIQKGLLRMMDKEKGLEWLRSTRLYMHADGTSIQSLTPDHTILFKSSGVKYLLIQQKPATQNDAPILLKAYVSGYNRMSPSGTLEFVANHYSSRVRHYSRLLGKAKTTADLHKIRKDRFGHLPNWGELPSSTKQMILNAEDEVHQYLTKQEEKAKADTPAEDRIDQSTWRQPRMFKSGLYLLRKSSPIANHPGYTLRTVVDSTGHQVHRWFRNGSGPADVNEHHHRQDSASAMRQAMVDVPMPTFGSNSPTNQQCLRRVNQLLALATQGDLDGISNFSTSRTRANYSRVADYREALLAAANNVREIPPPALGLPPEPSQVRGSNPNNGALISAQRKINRIYQAATTSEDPVAAILAIETLRSNGYTRAADDYRTLVLRHFGYQTDGNPIPGYTPEGAAPMPEAPVVAPEISNTEPPPAPEEAQPVPQNGNHYTVHPYAVRPENPIPGSANPYNMTADELGFTPRPDFPIDYYLTLHGYYDNRRRYGDLKLYPPGTNMDPVRAYLHSSNSHQTRARDYQTDAWHPETPALAAKRAKVAERQRQQAAREMAAQREAAVRYIASLDMTTEFAPIAVPGNNISTMTNRLIGSSEGLRGAKNLGGTDNPAAIEEIAKTMICDYGGNIKFGLTISYDPREQKLYFRYQGDDGTSINRYFMKNGGKLMVKHDYFSAGTKGGSSAKNFLRTSMGFTKRLS